MVKTILLAQIESQKKIIDEQHELLKTRWEQLKTSWRREERMAYDMEKLKERIKELEQGENR